MATNRRMNVTDTNDSGVGPGQVVVAGAQTFDPPGRWIIVSTAGTITGQLVEDTADVAYVLPIGVHKLAFKSASSTATIVACVVR